jgi:signal transduction histidine kinase
MDVLSLPDSALQRLVHEAPPGQAIARIPIGPGVHQVLTRRLDSSRVLALAIGPRTQLIPPAVLGRLLENGRERSPLYRLTVTPLSGLDGEGAPGRWRREDWAIRATRRLTLPSGPHEAHLVIPIGRPVAILVRGGILLIADLALAFALWGLLLWLLNRRIVIRPPWTTRSYETRLALTLASFFIVPAALISAVSIRQLAVEAERGRDLVLQRILRDAQAADQVPIADVARRLDAGLGLYRGGALVAASEPVLAALGMIPPLVDEAAWHALVLDGEPFASSRESGFTRRGFAMAGTVRGGDPAILATVHEERDRELRDRQLDVALAFGLATLLGLVAASGAARLAARTLSRPVADLRDAAIAFGQGTTAPPFPLQQPREFEPVFTAFARMAADVRAGQDALEAARQRTEAVLATVPTGVLAVDPDGRVILANRSAKDMLGDPLPAGRSVAEIAEGEWGALARIAIHPAMASESEFEAGGRRYSAQVTPLEGGNGSVVALNDVTVAMRAARVLAWADVANQVAHAIKNPLTPLRLGVQHLRRVREQRPHEFDTALEETTERLLAEITRLDSIARAFARFAAPSEVQPPLAPVTIGEVCDEVAALYHMAPGFDLHVAVTPAVTAIARRDELKEVLLNLCDNARNAGASRVSVEWEDRRLTLQDDGAGMAPEVLEHVFEPRFSTTSSGSGLGLAIARRLVESWGASISVESAPGEGARFRIQFAEPGI